MERKQGNETKAKTLHFKIVRRAHQKFPTSYYASDLFYYSLWSRVQGQNTTLQDCSESPSKAQQATTQVISSTTHCGVKANSVVLLFYLECGWSVKAHRHQTEKCAGLKYPLNGWVGVPLSVLVSLCCSNAIYFLKCGVMRVVTGTTRASSTSPRLH